MDVTQMVNAAVPTGYASLQRGYISGGATHPKAAPTAFTEGVWVILPEGSTEHLYGPCKWPAIHGTSKPQAGAVCVVGFDEQNHPVVVWWEGPQAEPVPGAESITEAMLKAEAVSEGKLAKVLQERVTQDSGWVAPTLEGVWVKLGAPLVGYRRQGNAVRLRGQIKGGASGSTAFTLPAGYRPAQQVEPIVGTAGPASGVLVIEPAGTVGVFFTGTSGKEATFLDGITFTID